MTDQEYKVLENRLRRAAARQGLRLEKSRRRDTRAYDYGTYQLVDPHSNTLVAYGLQSGYGMNLDEVAEQLLGEHLPTDLPPADFAGFTISDPA
jgi:hypothetical protein